MAGWFSRRSGSRVSIHNPVRRVLRALSLSRNPMPPRTTRKSDRRKASDRTMVGTAQPLCLSASGTDRRRCDGTMNLRKRKTHRVSLHYWGWTASTLCFAVAGEAFVLTSPFIERDYRNVARAEERRSGTKRDFWPPELEKKKTLKEIIEDPSFFFKSAGKAMQSRTWLRRVSSHLRM